MILDKSKPRPLAKKPVNLTDWIEAATRDIVPAAQRRIRVEVEAHYIEGLQASMRQGRTEAEAHVAALADLGDAEAAGVRFRREHLTTLDPDILANAAWLQIFLGILWAGAHLVLDSLPDPNAKPGPLGVVFILFTIFVVMPALAFAVGALVRRSRKALTQRLIILVLFTTWLNLGAFLTLQFDGPSSHDHSFPHSFNHLLNAFMFSWFAGWASFYLLRLRKKVVCALDIDFTPGDPASQ